MGKYDATVDLDRDYWHDGTQSQIIGGEEELLGREYGEDERIGDEEELLGNEELLGAEAVRAVIEKARDNRQPPPKMKAVPVDEPEEKDEVTDWLTDTFVGAAALAPEVDPFPITSKLLLRFGGGQAEPRYVRIDTEESYKDFRASQSPELAELRDRVESLEQALAEHEGDPNAHGMLSDEMSDVELVGAEAAQAEADKKVDMWLPERFDGKVHAWQENDYVCASIKLPGSDGELRICTSMMPIKDGVEEMARHASEAGVDEEVVGYLPAMGCVLGAGTLVKEMAAAAPSILRRPEAAKAEPFVVRIEPRANPALCALAVLILECRAGNQQACDEWRRLCAAAKAGGAVAVAKAMTEAAALAASAR